MSEIPDIPFALKTIVAFFQNNLMLFPIVIQIIGFSLLLIELVNFYAKYHWRSRLPKIIRAFLVFIFGVFLNASLPSILNISP